MIWTRTSGMMISSSERPNIDRGSSALQPVLRTKFERLRAATGPAGAGGSLALAIMASLGAASTSSPVAICQRHDYPPQQPRF